MKTQDILEEVTLEKKVAEDAAPQAEEEKVDLPEVTPEEYQELAALKSRQSELKLEGYDMIDFMERIDAEIARLTAEKAVIKEKLAPMREELTSVNERLQRRFDEVMSDLGFPPGTAVTISNDPPHYVMKQELPATG